MWGELLSELLHNHRGKMLGILIGLIFSLLVIFLGFFQTVFVACCIYIGYIIGRRTDDNDGLRELIMRFFNDR